MGDWGDVSPDDAQANEDAIKDELRILSAYRLKDQTKVWIITEADRSATTFLLPQGVLMDETEEIRRQVMAQYEPETERSALEAKYGQIWTTAISSAEFEVLGFLAPFVAVKRRIDGTKGSLQFQGFPPSTLPSKRTRKGGEGY